MSEPSARRPLRIVATVLETVCAISLWVIVVVLGLGALERNFLSTSVLSYADSLYGYLMAALVLLGITVALADNGHVRIDIFLRRVSFGERWIGVLFRLMGVCSGLIIAGGGFVLASQSFRTGRINYGFVDIALWIPQSLIVVGGVLFAASFLLVGGSATQLQDDAGSIPDASTHGDEQ